MDFRKLEATSGHSIDSIEFATLLDSTDSLSILRSDFCIPKKSIVIPSSYKVSSSTILEEECIYLAGNSLGLMPKRTIDLVNEELNVWSQNGVMGHHLHPHKRPWIEIDEIVTTTLADIIGAKQSEVACMGTLTSNLHQLLTCFYKPTEKRNKILYEGKAFPSDQYAFASQIESNGLPSTCLLPINPREGEFTIRTDDILKLIQEQGETISIICFGAIQYYSGEWFEMEKITKAGQSKGCLVSFDLAHAIGNVPMKLHDWGVDFAIWCSYKYLCSGPGGIAGLYVHEKWSNRPRLSGWWGHEIETRFAMPSNFIPSPGAGGFQLSNPSVLDVISLYSALESFKKSINPSCTTIPISTPEILNNLRSKSINLTNYLQLLLCNDLDYLPLDQFINFSSLDQIKFTIITPLDSTRRGAQISILFSPPEKMDFIFKSLLEQGVLSDERKPGVIRLSPVPMYNSFQDVRKLIISLRIALSLSIE